MKSLNVLIVEDELLIAETIKLFLQERGHQVVGMAISYDEAIEKIENLNPDLSLLDIRLYGEKSGIDVAHYINKSPDPKPFVIVSSQYDSAYIEKAMQAKASGYITKPISKETLWSTIELASLKADQELAETSYVDLKISHGIQRVQIKDILYIKSDHVYVEVVCRESKYFCRYALSELLSIIDEASIIQCHRSYLINSELIQKFDGSKLSIEGIEIPVSNKYKKQISELFDRKV